MVQNQLVYSGLRQRLIPSPAGNLFLINVVDFRFERGPKRDNNLCRIVTHIKQKVD